MPDRVLKYLAIKRAIAQRIVNEDYKIDLPIPTEAELTQMFNVSRITVRKAIDELVNEGMLYRVQGKGTFVRSDENLTEVFSITSCTEDIVRRGMTPQTRLISAKLVPADKRVARKLHIASEDPVFRLERTFYADLSPLNHTVSYHPADIFPGIEQRDFARGSLYAVIEGDYGVKITHARRTFEAVIAHDEVAAYLQLGGGEPLILFECETYGELPDGHERVIEFFSCHYRTDKYTFYVNQMR